MDGLQTLDIVSLRSTPEAIAALAELLTETVAGGASVSFMYPLAPEVAAAFWTNSLAAADAGGRVVLGAMEDGKLVGTVTLLLDFPPNQPHRGEIAKMMTCVNRRGRGIARALMVEAERIAVERGRTLLTLDTGTDDGAGAFYAKLGFVQAGVIPDFALKPFGGLQGTTIYWKRIGATGPELAGPQRMTQLSNLPGGGQAQQAWSKPPRSKTQRRADVLRKLENENKLWIATASPDGTPHLVPFSYLWDGEGITMATTEDNPAAQNIARTGKARVALGDFGDVVLIDGPASVVSPREIDDATAERLARVSAIDGRTAPGFVYLQLVPARVQAWWSGSELGTPTIMRDGRWLT
jgi:GNAT superfamily N-acetyltransferase/general stress protein 26